MTVDEALRLAEKLEKDYGLAVLGDGVSLSAVVLAAEVLRMREQVSITYRDWEPPTDLEVIRRAIGERDEAQEAYQLLAHTMVYEGNSVHSWHSKAQAYKRALGGAWAALKKAGITADGAMSVTDGIEELATEIQFLKDCAEDE